MWRSSSPRPGLRLPARLVARRALDHLRSDRGEALELWILDLQSGAAAAADAYRRGDTEPRFSPDGRRVVFISTPYQRHFHVFVADFNDSTLGDVRRLTGENKSPLPRYYYSDYDHEINPVWTRDGRGSSSSPTATASMAPAVSGEWPRRPRRDPDRGAREFHYEETNWQARPDFSPDGTRLVYSSYLGRTRHLWLLPAAGGSVPDRLWRLGCDRPALVP